MEPIAIVGMAGRFPASPDLDTFWQNLVDGRDCLTDLTDEELLARGELPQYLAHPGYVRRRPVLDGADEFDARAFGLTPREAELRDPQQRVLLEVAYSALEHAGYDPFRYPGRIGAFAGTNLNRYRTDHLESSPQVRQSAGFLGIDIGNSPDYVATFLSHRLGLRGPSTTVQTACSTAHTAIHLACQSLRAGDCEMALAGASSVGLPLDYGYVPTEGGILAHDGTPRPFDADADGTNFGNGVGVLVLKRLTDALADRDTVVAVIRGSALNNDGARRTSFSAPSAAGQADCVADALRTAGVDPRDLSFVEAHGTGTRLGDPVEVAGLAAGFAKAADGELPPGYCRIGSVKGNVGHVGQASGACGVIKTALALSRELIPATINLRTVNPLLRLEQTPFTVATTAEPWPRGDGKPRRAGVSSFGIGGTNGHVILEEAPLVERPPVESVAHPELIVWSAATPEAADTLAEDLAGHFAARPSGFADAAYTLRVGRRERRHRAAVVANDAADAARLLRTPGAAIRAAGPPRDEVLCFPGQGVQRARMSFHVYETSPAFRRHCDETFALLRPHVDGDLRALWLAGDELTETAVAQPVLFVIEYALARTLLDWGLAPARLIGHSLGELVAATVAGVFDPADGVAAVAARARMMQDMPRGSMVSVAAGVDQVADHLTDVVGVAAVNGPHQTVLSGPDADLTAVVGRLAAAGMRTTPLATSHAFHSAAMAPAAKAFEEFLGGLTLYPPTVPVISCATGAAVSDDEAVTPAFWAEQLVAPVRFADGLRAVVAAGPAALVEAGPGRTLTALASRLDEVRAGGTIALPTDGDGALERMLGRLWVEGLPVDLAARDRGTAAFRVPMPGYPFQRKRFWIERPAGVVPARDNEIEPLADPSDAPAVVASGRVDAAAMAVAGTAVAAAPILDERRETWSVASVEWIRIVDGRDPEPGRRADGVDAALVLPADPTEATVVRTAFQLAGYRTTRVIADDLGDWDTFLDGATSSGRPAVVAYAALLDDRADPMLSTVDERLDRVYFAVRDCARAAARLRRRLRGPVTLLVLTRRAVDVSGADPVDPVAAMVPALLRTVEQEHPGVRCVAVDVAPRTPVEVLAAAVGAPAVPLVALRGASTWSPTLRRPVRTVRAGRPRLRRGGVYLITGGFGGIGMTIARALAETGLAPRLALLGRSGGAGVADLIDAGAEVLTLTADVADPGSLEQATSELEQRFGTVHGVVHAAGVAGGGLLDTRERADSMRVFAPKVHGTLALDQCFARRPALDFFVVFSSQAAVTGMLGSADYAAANAFLDTFARGRSGGWTMSIGWPAWATRGMWAAPDDLPDGPRYERTLDVKADWELDEHRVAGTPVVADTVLLEHVAVGARDLGLVPADRPVELRDTVFIAPAGGADTVTLRVTFTAVDGVHRFAVHGKSHDAWHHHASGTLTAGAPPPAPADLEALWQRAATVPPVPWTGPARVGPRWQTVSRMAHADGENLVELVLPAHIRGDVELHPWHPALLDRARQALGVGQPFLYRRVTLHRPLPVRVLAIGRPGTPVPGMESVDLDLHDAATGDLVAAISGVTVRPTEGADPVARLPRARSRPAELDVSEGRAPLSPHDGAAAFLHLLDGAYPPVVLVEPPGQPLSIPGLPWVDATAVAAPEKTPTAAMPGQALTAAAPAKGLTTALGAVARATPSTAAASGLATPVRGGSAGPVGGGLAAPVRGGLAAPVAGGLANPVAGGPAAAVAGEPAAHVTGEPVAPTADDITARLVELWVETLGIDAVAEDDDFFELGGDSLVAVQLSALVRRRFGVELSAATLFEASTIRALAREVTALHGGTS